MEWLKNSWLRLSPSLTALGTILSVLNLPQRLGGAQHTIEWLDHPATRWALLIVALFLWANLVHQWQMGTRRTPIAVWRQWRSRRRALPFEWNFENLLGGGSMSGGIHFVPSLVVTGTLTGKRLVHLKSAEMISLTTGQKLPMKIYAKDGAIDVSEAELIPPGANIRLETMLNAGQQPGGRPVMEKNDFLEKWGSYAFVVEFDDKKYEEVFSSEVVAARFTKPRRPVRPQVTRRSHA